MSTLNALLSDIRFFFATFSTFKFKQIRFLLVWFFHSVGSWFCEYVSSRPIHEDDFIVGTV